MSNVQRMRTQYALIGLMMIALAVVFGGCENGSPRAIRDDSFMVPSVVGRWEEAPERAAAESTVATSPTIPLPSLEFLGVPGTSIPAAPATPTTPGSMPSPDEEVWVIVRDRPQQEQQRAAADDPTPRFGTMLTHRPNVEQPVALPLKHTDVNGSITGYIASVEVQQQFHNPYDAKIEAVYVFPLPQNAAVNDFIMTVGERKIRGIIRDREEATRIYTQARAQGHTASLLTQERPNIFTQSVANIEPGKQIDVNIRYFHTLAYDDGWYEFVFPMVIGPRYNPSSSTAGIGAVPRGSHGASGQQTEVQYLAPNERSGHTISLNVELNAGVIVEQIKSVNHAVAVQTVGGGTTSVPNNTPVVHAPGSYIGDPGQTQYRIAIDAEDSIPNKDFVLRWRVAGDTIKAAFLAAPAADDAADGYFTLMLVPPHRLAQLRRQPLEMIFVVDASGSMNGQPIDQVKAAMDHALQQMEPSDTFQIISFANQASQFSDRPVPASAANVRRGRSFVSDIRAGGGTEMLAGIKASLDFAHDPERLRVVCLMTDGFIGNEAAILSAIHEQLGSARIFSFGVGSSPNRYLMDRMAKFGRGAVAYLSLEDDAADVMDHFFERISHPAMANLRIDWGGLPVRDVHPQPMPDLFVGRAVTITGRLDAVTDTTHTLRVHGEAGGSAIEVGMRVNARDASAAANASALPAVWARQKIAALYDLDSYEPSDELLGEIKEVALTYNLISAYTAFVAVDSIRVTEGGEGTTVPVAVPVPHGVKYETTVPGVPGVRGDAESAERSSGQD